MRWTLTVIAVALLSIAPAWAESDGGWQKTANGGCLVWNEDPQPDETVTWTGGCRNGKTTGHGTNVWRYLEDGTWKEDRYIGDMRDGKMHGRGTITLADGSRFEGEYRNGKPNGNGTFTTGSVTLTGNWTNGCFQQGNRKAWVATSKEECGFR